MSCALECGFLRQQLGGRALRSLDRLVVDRQRVGGLRCRLGLFELEPLAGDLVGPSELVLVLRQHRVETVEQVEPLR